MTAYAMPKIGDVLAGKYRLEKVAGEGGMGIVYAAEHLLLKQRVAVKVLLPDAATSEAVVERFAREAQAAARIQSEHIARVTDAGSLAGGAPFLVMEYLEGCDLEELFELQGALPVGEVVDYGLQALEALAHAHAVGIVHRDLKPANLFLACRPDGGNVLKLLDFGISKALSSDPTEKRLTGQHVLGSPVYMSPEQLRNDKTIDARADLWSLGVVIYELLSSEVPFDGEGVGEIFAAILEKEPAPLYVRNPKVPKELSDVIAKCLRRDPAERWRDAAELARALVPFGSGRWSSVVLRIEQVLDRARRLTRVKTPPEMRVVVDAIALAAERARTGTRSAPPPSDRTEASRASNARVPRWAFWTVGAAAAAAAGALVLGVVGANASSSLASAPEASAADVPDGVPKSAASSATDAAAATGAAHGAQGTHDAGAASVGAGSPATSTSSPSATAPVGAPHAHAKAKHPPHPKPSASVRPQFLKTRE